MLLPLLLACHDPAPPAPTPAPESRPSTPLIPDGPAWMTAEGSGLVRLEGGDFTAFPGPRDVLDLARGPDGRLWALSSGALWRMDGAALTRVVAVPDNVEAIAVDPVGTVWGVGFLTWGRYAGEKWQEEDPRDLGAGSDPFKDVAVDARGRVCIASNSRVFAWDGQRWTPHDLASLVPDLTFLDEVLPTADAVLVSGVDARAEPFLLRGTDAGWTRLPDPVVFDAHASNLALDAKGRLLASTSQGYRTADGTEVTPETAGYRAFGVQALAADARGRTWLGTDLGLVVVDADGHARQWTPGTVPEIQGRITRILVDAGGPALPTDAGPARGRVRGRMLRDGKPIAGATVALCSDVGVVYTTHPCEGSAVHLDATTAADGTFSLEGVPFGGLHLHLGEGSQWTVVLGAACCEVRPGGDQDLGDVEVGKGGP